MKKNCLEILKQDGNNFIIKEQKISMTWRGVQGRKKKLEKLYEESHRHYGGAYKDDDGRIIHRSFSRNSDMPKFYKRKSNKKLRQMKDEELPDSYKKAYDYWWRIN